MNRSDRGRVRQRKRGTERGGEAGRVQTRISLLLLSLRALNRSKVSLMGCSVDQVIPPLVLSHLPSFDMLMFYLPGWK